MGKEAAGAFTWKSCWTVFIVGNFSRPVHRSLDKNALGHP